MPRSTYSLLDVYGTTDIKSVAKRVWCHLKSTLKKTPADLWREQQEHQRCDAKYQKPHQNGCLEIPPPGLTRKTWLRRLIAAVTACSITGCHAIILSTDGDLNQPAVGESCSTDATHR